MNPIAILEKYYPPGSPAHSILLGHSLAVAEKAESVTRRFDPIQVDAGFVREAAILHDIGILFTSAPGLGCDGPLPYLAHGVKGREILEAEGLHRHALVCERHIGVGLSAEEIAAQGLPVPIRDMTPITLEEQIVTYADLFFSKKPAENNRERSADEVRQSLARFGEDKAAIFDFWHSRFAG